MTSFSEDLEHCLDTLKNGGVILYPTDTIWGLGCDATNEEAVARIFRIKQRPDNKSMIVLVADERDILQYVSAVDLSVFDYLASQSRPTTVIYPGAIGLAENLVSEDGSVGIRIVNDEFCRHLIKRFRKPIVSTSANISGMPAPANFKEINYEIRKSADYIVQHRQNDNEPSMPSSIVKWNNGSVTVIR